MQSMTDVFRSRVVQAIMLSGLFLQIGIWVRNFAVLLFVVDKTNGDPLAVSMISVAEFAPIFIFSFIGGTFADRWRPRRTMIWCDLLSALSVFGVLAAMVYASWKAVFFVTLVSAILSQFSQPSGMKLFKQHLPLEQIQAGMSLYQTMFAVFMVIGPMLGTFVYQSMGINAAVAIMGTAFVLSAGALVFLPADRDCGRGGAVTTLRQEMAAGFRYVLANKTLLLLSACFAAAGLALGLTQPLGVFLVTERLGLPKENLQWLLMAYGGGMLAGGALALGLSRTVAPQRMLMAGTLVFAVVYAVIGWSTSLWITLLAHVFAGMVLPAVEIGFNTMMLQNTAESFVGRVNGILSPLFFGSMVVMMSMAGLLKHWFSLPVIFMAAAVLFLVSALVILPIYNAPRKAGRIPAHEPE